MDFENDSLVERLAEGGFDASRPALVSWLGVVMYLTREAIGETLAVIGGFPSGTELVLDSMLTADLVDAAGREYADGVSKVAAERGEPWLSFFSPADMSAILDEHGLTAIEHVGQREAVDAALWNRTDAVRPIGLSMLTHARVSQRRYST
jgi:O-methyltransferase involved in polyketide biosynthesis